MAGKNKNKKRPQTGGLQPKGGAYANVADASIENDDIMVANSKLKDKEKSKPKTDAKKDKDKVKKGKPMGRIGMLVGLVIGSGIGALLWLLVDDISGWTWPVIIGGVLGAITLGIVFRNLQKFKETGAELKKVRWPTLKSTWAKTLVVLGVVLVFSIVIFLLDLGLGALYRILTSGY